MTKYMNLKKLLFTAFLYLYLQNSPIVQAQPATDSEYKWKSEKEYSVEIYEGVREFKADVISDDGNTSSVEDIIFNGWRDTNRGVIDYYFKSIKPKVDGDYFRIPFTKIDMLNFFWNKKWSGSLIKESPIDSIVIHLNNGKRVKGTSFASCMNLTVRGEVYNAALEQRAKFSKHIMRIKSIKFK